MSKVRVLVVDDSAVVRRLVTAALSEDPGVEVVGVAAHGREALDRIPELAPDLLTLDVEMPTMDGLQTLAALRAQGLTMPVIMLSSHTERGAAATLDSLLRGAKDYVTKPHDLSGSGAAVQRLRAELLPRIHALCPDPAVVPPSTGKKSPASRAGLLVVAASTGGPQALLDFFEALPAPFPVPVAVVQHMPALFTRALADRLSDRVAHRVHEAQDGDLLRPGGVWIAPGNRHLEIHRHGGDLQARIQDGAPENGCRPSADVLFRSAVRALGDSVVAVVLTGMGHDGETGARALHAAGGLIYAQDEPSSVVWGMPGAIVRAGIAHAVLPPRLLAFQVARQIAGSEPGRTDHE
jgi:two-component system chemotaxis response regulator CheB